MKYIVILLLLIALVAWLAYRFRRQIAIGRQIWKMLADASRAANRQNNSVQQKQQRKDIPAGKLIRCSKCQSWVPEETAIRLGLNDYFCSSKCMEKSVVNSQ
jgi:Tfp pilus assembly protein PilN